MWEVIYAVVTSDRVDDDMMRCTCSRSHVIFFFTTYCTRIRILSEPYVLFPRGHRHDDMRAFVFPHDIFYNIHVFEFCLSHRYSVLRGAPIPTSNMVSTNATGLPDPSTII